jgi:pSer/pThr/pTyr-binding forkhead associated (FHA) protein
MVQLQVLSGNRAGTRFCADHFPIQIGRADDSDFILLEPGVWPRHFRIDWKPEGLILEADADAIVGINDTPVRQAVLRNGDVITVGSTKIRFSLSAVRQSSSTMTEWLTWISVGVLCAFQIALVYLLLRF